MVALAELEDLGIELIEENRLVDIQPRAFKEITTTIDERKSMLALYLSMGLRPRDIAVRLGVSDSWIRTNRRGAEVQSVVKVLQQEAIDGARLVINHNTVRAAETLAELVDSGPPSIRLGAAREILNRVPELAATVKEERNIKVSFGHMSKEELQASIQERMKVLEYID